jgi:hypothetical protein
MEIPDFESPMKERIEQALRRYRFETGKDLTWKELGKQVWARLGRKNVDTSKISRLKNDLQKMTIAEGGAFAYELDVSPVWLFWELGEMGRFPPPVQVAAGADRTAPLKRERKPAPATAEPASARKTGGSK